MEEQEYNKLLGLVDLNNNNMDKGMDAAGALKAQNDPLYRTSFGDFTPDVVYDPYDAGAFSPRRGMYRGDPNLITQAQYENQRNYARVLNGIGRVGGGAALKAVQGVGFLGALGYETFRGFLDGVDTEGNAVGRAVDNGFSQFFMNLEESFKENVVPILKPENYDEMGILGKMFNSGGSFFLDEVADGLAFMLSTYVPGGMLSKLNTGSKMAKYVGGALQSIRARRATAGVGEKLVNLKRIADNLDKLTLGTTMTAMEAAFEAKGVKDSIMANEKLRRKYGKEDLEKLAHQRAADAFALNMVFLAPSNALEIGTIFNKASKAGRAAKSRSNPYGIGFDKKTGKAMITEPVKQRSIGKAIAANIAAEGLWEENIQYTIDKLSSYVDDNALKKDVMSAGLWDGISKGFKNLDTLTELGDEGRLESVVLGGIIGGGTVAAGQVSVLNKMAGGDGTFKEQFEIAQKKQNEALKFVEQADISKLKPEFFRRMPDSEVTLRREPVEGKEGEFTYYEDKDGTTVDLTKEAYDKRAAQLGLPEEGGQVTEQGDYLVDTKEDSLVMDPEKVKRALVKQLELGEIQELDDVISQYENRNPIAMHLIKRTKLQKLAHFYFHAGMAEEFYDKLNELRYLEGTELQSYGFDPKENVDEQVDSAISYVEKLENHFNNMQQSIMSTSMFKERRSINEDRISFLEDRFSMVTAIDEALSKNRELFNKDMEQRGRNGAAYATNPYLFDSTMRDTVRDTVDNKDTLTEEELAERGEEISEANSASIAANKMFLVEEMLTSSRSELNKDYEDVAHIIKGEKYYRNNRKELAEKFTKERLNNLVLKASTTVEEYRRYENTQLKRMQTAEKMRQIEREHASRLWRLFMVNNNSVPHLLKFIIENELVLTANDLQELKGISSEFIAHAESLKTQLAEIFQEMGEAEAYGEIDRFHELKNKEEELNQEYEQILEAFTGDRTGRWIYNNVQDLMTIIQDRSEVGFEGLKEEELRKKIALEYTRIADAISEAAMNDLNFEDVKTLETLIESVTALKRIFTERDDIKESLKNAIIKEADKSLAKLQEALEEVRRRISDRSLQEAKKHKAYVTNLYALLGYDLESNTFNSDNGGSNGELFQSLVEANGQPFMLDWMSKVKEDVKTQKAELDEKEQGMVVPSETYIFAALEQVSTAPVDVKNKVNEAISSMITESTDFIKNIGIMKELATESEQSAEDYKSALELIDNINYNSLRVITVLLRDVIGELVEHTNRNEIGFDATPESAIYRFLDSNDLYQLLIDVETEDRPSAKISKEELTQTVQNFIKITSLNLLDTVLNSPTSTQGLLQQELSINSQAKASYKSSEEDTIFVPSASQRISIYQMIRNYQKSVDITRPMSNVTFLKGAAGTGKTNVVVRWVMKLLGIEPNTVMTAGHNTHSGSVIENSIDSGNGVHTFEDIIGVLEKGHLPEGINTLIFDEIPSLIGHTGGNVEGVTLNRLHDLLIAETEYQKSQGVDLKIIYLGDPNQITESRGFISPLESGLDSQIPGINNIVTVPPLTTRYRSNNPSIVNIQNAFINKHTPVESLNGSINIRPEEVGAIEVPLIGSYIEPTNANLMKVLEHQLNTDMSESPKRRVIIVGGHENRVKYEKHIEDQLGKEVLESGQVEVITVYDIQGQTVEEAYVDLSDFQALDDKIKNKALYTGASRAKNFLYMAGIPKSSVNKDPQLQELTDRNEINLDEVYDQHKESVEKQLKIYQDLNVKTTEDSIVEDEETPSSTPVKDIDDREESTPDVVDVTRVLKEDNEDTDEPSNVDERDGYEDDIDTNDIIDADPILNEDEVTGKEYDQSMDELMSRPNVIQLREPSTDAFYETDNNVDSYFKGLTKMLDEDGKVDAEIASIYTPDGLKVAVIYPINESRNEYKVLAVLTQNEVGNLKIFDKIRDNVRGDFEGNNVVVLENKPSQTIKVTVQKESHKPKYIIDGPTKAIRNHEQLVKEWIDSMNHSTNDNPLSVDPNYRVEVANEEEMIDSAKVHVWSKKDSGSSRHKNYGGRLPLNRVLGIPFLRLSGIKRRTVSSFTENESERTSEAMIQLTPRRINKNMQRELLQPIEAFINEVEAFEKILADGNVNVKLGDPNFARLVTQLVDLKHSAVVYGNEYASKDILEEHENWMDEVRNTLGIDLNVPLVKILYGEFENLFNRAEAIDRLIHGDVTLGEDKNGKEKITRHRRHRGPAQVAMDQIAAANFAIYGEDNIPKVLRTTRKVSREGETPIEKTVGRLLLGTVEQNHSSRYYSNQMASVVRDKFLRRLQKNFGFTLAQALKAAEGMKFNRTLDSNNRLQFTSQELRSFFIEGYDDRGYSTLNQGFGLRIPINANEWYNKRLSTTQSGKKPIAPRLGDYFESNFGGVVGTKLFIQIQDETIEAKRRDKVDSINGENTEISSTEVEDNYVEESPLDDENFNPPLLLDNEYDPGRELSIEETKRLMRQFNPKSFRAVVRRFLSRKKARSSEEDSLFKLLDQAEMSWLAGTAAWGAYKDGMVYLTESSKGGAYSKALAHEQFHRITQWSFTAAQRDKMYNMAMEQNPTLKGMSLTEVEEWLARRFMEYSEKRLMKSGNKIGEFIRRLFDMILRGLNLLKQDFDSIEELFNQVYKGHYTGKGEPTNSSVVWTLQDKRIRDLFNNSYEVFDQARNTVLAQIRLFYNSADKAKAFQEDLKESIPFTFGESIQLAFNNMKNEYNVRLPKRIAELENKEVLTEEEQKRLDTLKEALKRYSIVSNKEAYMFLANNLFPVDATIIGSIDQLDLDNYAQTETDVEDRGPVLNMDDEISSKDLYNTVKNTTVQVKLAFSNVWTASRQLSDGRVKEPRKVRPEKAFAIAINLLADLPVTANEKQMLDHLKSGKLDSSYDADTKAVFLYIKRQIQTSAEEKSDRISIIDDNTVIVRKEDSEGAQDNIEDISVNQARNRRDTEVIKRDSRTSTPRFFSQIANDHNFTAQEVSQAVRVHRAREFVRDISTSLMSLEDRNPLQGTKFREGESIKFVYGSGRTATVKEIYASSIKEALVSYYNNGATKSSKIPGKKGQSFPDIEMLYRKELGTKTDVVDEQRAKRKVIQNIFSDAGLPKVYVNAMPTGTEVVSLFDTLKTMIQSAREHIGKDFKDIADFMDNQERFTRDLTLYLSVQDMYLAVSTYLNGNGDRVSIKKKSSFGGLVLNYLSLPKGDRKELNRPSHLTKDFNYHMKNIFMNGMQELIRYGDHDSTKWSRASYATTHKKESKQAWLERNYLYQFMATLNNSSGQRYFQQIYTTSDKPTMRVAEVNFIPNKDINDYLLNMLDQELSRDESDTAEMTKQKSYLKNYTPDISYLIGIRGEKLSSLIKDPNYHDTFLQRANEALDESAEKLFEEMVKLGVYLPDGLLDTYKIITGETPSKNLKEIFKEMKRDHRLDKALEDQSLSREAYEEADEETKSKIQGLMTEYYNKNSEELRDIVVPILKAFVRNFYINSHQLNQLVAGDQAHYKTGQETDDLIKRMSIAFGPGSQGKVGKNYTKPETNIAILEDHLEYMSAIEGIRPENVDSEYESTDAQGFVLPEYARQLQKGHGANAKIGNVLKPVFFGHDKYGIPRALKFSATVLTDELVEQFPALKDLRTKMRNNRNADNASQPIDMVTFDSALKVGKISKQYLTHIHARDENGKVVKERNSEGKLMTKMVNDLGTPNTISNSSVLTLDSAHMRIQLNPDKSPLGLIANPTQLPYLTVINQDIKNLSNQLLELTAKRMSIGSKLFDSKYALNNGQPTRRTQKILMKNLREMLEKIEGSSNEAYILNIDGISINVPILTDKIISSLGNSISKSTSNFKIKGGKLVLQSAYGTDTVGLDQEGNAIKEPLKWRKSDGYTEVYVTEELLTQYGLNIGDTIADKALASVAFRIPSTGIHSAIVMKIKGVYKTDPGKSPNIIIAPSEIVDIHGSDYDVDSLMFITRNRWQDAVGDHMYDIGKDLATVFRTEHEPIIKRPLDIINYLAFERTDTDLKSDMALIKTVKRGLIAANMRKEALLNNPKTDTEDAEAWKAELQELNKIIKRFHNILALSTENEMVDTYIKILTHASSRIWMELPITMNYLKSNMIGKGLSPSSLDIIARMKGAGYPRKNGLPDFSQEFNIDLFNEQRNEVLYGDRDPSNVLDQLDIHYQTFSGASLTGISANSAKVLAYLVMSAENGEMPQLKEAFHIVLNGGTYDRIQHTEMDVDAKGNLTPSKYKRKAESDQLQEYTIWELIDSLINSSIDNVKEGINALINLNGRTANPYFAGIGLGIPMNTMVRIMNQGSIEEIAVDGTAITPAYLSQMRSKYITQYVEKKKWKEKLTQEQLDAKISELKHTQNLTDERLTEAYREYNDKKEFNSEEALLTQIETMNLFIKLSSIGDSLFEASNVSLLIRSVPNNYAKTKDLVNQVLNDMTAEEEDQDIVEDIITGEDKIYSPSESWPFTNANLLNLPHFQEGIRNALKFTNLVENIIYKHSSLVDTFVDDLLGEYLNSKGLSQVEKEVIKNDFITYLNSGMNIRYGDHYLDMTIPSNTTTDSRGNELHGFRAWTFNLIQRIQMYNVETPNRFASRVIANYNKYGREWRILFTAHKNLDLAGKHELRIAFQEMPLDIQLDLLKYLMLTRGISFGATSYAEILPDDMFKIYSQALKYDSPKKKSDIEKYFDSYALLFFRNNPKIVPRYTSKDVGIVLGEDGQASGRTTVELEGNVSQEIIYDLAIKGNRPKIIQYKDKKYTMYVKIPGVSTPDMSYYRRVGSMNYQKQYTRTKRNNTFTGFNVESIITPNTMILSELGLEGNQMKIKGHTKLYEGDFIYLRSPQDVGMENLTKYSVDTIDRTDKNQEILTVTKLYDVDPYIYPEPTKVDTQDTPTLKLSKRSSSQERAYSAYNYRQALKREIDYKEGRTGEDTRIEDTIREEKRLEEESHQAFRDFNDAMKKERDLDKAYILDSEYGLGDIFNETQKKQLLEQDFTKLTVDQILTAFKDHMTAEQKQALEKLRKIENSKVYFTPRFYGKQLGDDPWGLSNDIITLVSVADSKPQQIIHTVLHELTHRHTFTFLEGAVTQLKKDSNSKFSKEQLETAEALNESLEDILDQIRKHPEVKAYQKKHNVKYSKLLAGLENISELVAEVYSNPQLREFLSELQIEQKGKVTEKRNFFQRIIDWIVSFFNGVVSDKTNYWSATKIIDDITSELFVLGKSPEQHAAISRIKMDVLSNEDALNYLSRSGYFMNRFEYANYISQRDNPDADKVYHVVGARQGFRQRKSDDNFLIDRLHDELSKENIRLTEDEEHYTDESKRLFTRLGNYVSSKFAPYKNKFDTPEEYFADKDFRAAGLSRNDKYRVNDGVAWKEYTFEERMQYHKRETNLFRAYGNLAHALIEKYLSHDPNRIRELEEEIAGYYAGDEFTDPIPADSMKWLMDDIKNILDKSGIHFDSDIGPNDLSYKYLDKVSPELAVTFKALGIGTRIDGLVQHKDESVSIIDWKTQKLLSDQGRTDYMNWGATYGIRNTKLDRAKLEVVLRAMAIKDRHPETKFNILSVNWLNKRQKVRVYHIDIAPYLGMISDMLQAENPEVHKELNAKGLFDADTYYREFIPDRELKSLVSEITSSTPAEQAIEILDNKIESIYAQYTTGDIANNSTIRKQLELLVEQRAGYALGTEYKIEKDEDDLTRITKGLLNLKDSRHKIVQMFNKSYFKARDKANEDKLHDWQKHDKYYRDVVVEYFEKKGLGGLAKRALTAPINSLPFGSIDSRELNMFMWRKYDQDGKKGWYANQEDTYLPEGATQEVALTDAQKAYRKFYHDTIAKRYNELYTQELVSPKGRRVSKGKFQGLPVLENDFMPRIQPSKADIKARWGLLTNFGKRQEELFKFAMTNYVVDNYQTDSSKGIPMRYAMQTGSSVIENEEHSLNAERAFKLFISNIHAKKNLDSAYTLGKAIQVYVSTALNEQGQSKYEYLNPWIEDMLSLHILNDSDDGDFHYREWKVKVPKMLRDRYGEDVKINAWAVGKWLKSTTSLIGMAVKPVPALFNGALIFLTNHYKGLSNSIAHRIFNVDKDELAFTFSDVWNANLQWGEYIGKWIRGQGKETKLWNLSRNLRFLPDNYDYAVQNDDMLFVKNRLFSRSSLYYFHTMFESYGAHHLLVAMSKKLKYKWTNGKETKIASMWEMYNDKGYIEEGWTRGFTKDSQGNMIPLAGYTSEEINAMKKTYERLHGSYRQEERLSLELTIFGQWALQFKKYLPTLIKENYRRKNISPFVGVMKQVGVTELERDENGNIIVPEGVDIYEWEEIAHEGRVRIMYGGVKSLLGLTSKDGKDSQAYSWERLSSDQQASLVNALMTLFLMPAVIVLMGAGFDDDEKNKYYFKRTQRLVEDLTLGLNPMDLARPVTNPFPAVSKLVEIFDATGMFVVDGVMGGEKDRRGLPKGLYNVMRNVPFGSGIHQWNYVWKEIDRDRLLFEDTLETLRR